MTRSAATIQKISVITHWVYHESASRGTLVPTLNLCPFEVRVIWDTGASKTIGGMHEEEAIFRGANHVRIGAGIDWRDDRGDLSKAGGVAANFLSLEEKVWSDGIDGDTQTQAT